MQPGDNCRSCHGGPSSPYPEAPEWGVAGTVFEGPTSDVGVAGVIVEIVDASGKLVELTTNSVGNFYTPQSFETPYFVTLKKDGVQVTMPTPPPSGGCNACHNQPAVGDAPGRLYLPEMGHYESKAVCDEEHTVVVGATNFDCAPYRCAPASDTDGAHCLGSCSSDDDCTTSCVEGRCSQE